MKINSINNLIKDFQLFCYVQRIFDPQQFSQRQTNFKIHLLTKTSLD